MNVIKRTDVLYDFWLAGFKQFGVRQVVVWSRTNACLLSDEDLQDVIRCINIWDGSDATFEVVKYVKVEQ